MIICNKLWNIVHDLFAEMETECYEEEVQPYR